LKEFFENGTAAFQGKARSDHQTEQERIEFLQKKIQRKDEVLADLMAEHIALKKEQMRARTEQTKELVAAVNAAAAEIAPVKGKK
jgi:hypothetical protein